MTSSDNSKSLLTVLKKIWGYDSFRPLQQSAMESVLNGHDSLVVLPTGGGKSLCFQAPALLMDGLAIVVSPLISLMKDQVDALKANGVTAASINSSMSDATKQEVNHFVSNGKIKVLYVSPERLMTEDFASYLKQWNVSFIAIDEAHCVSIWGHDFRPEYGQLGIVKTLLPGIPVHAYTATATEQVRADVIDKLKLDKPEILVGQYDRPNLIYSSSRAEKKVDQVCEVIERHRNESGIIYCIRRKDVDDMCLKLLDRGYKVLPYHAGMDPADRQRNQEFFIQEKVDIIVATIAFGMGIDKSNVRFVVHAGMPKSLEHYQQESGRAGRDGLNSECILLYSGADMATWNYFLKELEGDVLSSAMTKLYAMSDYCSSVECRHKALVNYFGQDYDKPKCDACDVCLGGIKLYKDSLLVSQKILSCVKRLNERFGAGYVAQVLHGSQEQRIISMKHDKLSTWGLLSEFSLRQIRDWIEQLISQGCLVKDGEFSTISVTRSGWDVLKGKVTPSLLKPILRKKREQRISKAAAKSWEGVDRNLFEKLRELRREIADEKGVPAFVIFGDASLRDMATVKPVTMEQFYLIFGVGAKKAREYGAVFTKLIREEIGKS